MFSYTQHARVPVSVVKQECPPRSVDSWLCGTSTHARVPDSHDVDEARWLEQHCRCTLLPSEKKKASGSEGAQVIGATGVAEPRGRKDTLRVAHQSTKFEQPCARAFVVTRVSRLVLCTAWCDALESVCVRVCE